MRHNNYEFDGYTGHLFEAECLGEVLVLARGREYRPYAAAMKEVKKTQPWNPTDPRPRPANDLHASVCEALGVEDYTEVALYTSVGSALDFYHGVDAFIEWRGMVVTIDLTVNDAKTAAKADLVFRPADFESNLEVAAGTVASRLLAHRGRKAMVA